MKNKKYRVFKTKSSGNNNSVGLGSQMYGKPAAFLTINYEIRDLWKKAAIDKDKDAISEVNSYQGKAYVQFKEVNDCIGYPAYLEAYSIKGEYIRTNLVIDVHEVEDIESVPKKWFDSLNVMHPLLKNGSLKEGDILFETKSGSQYTLILDKED